MLPAIGYALRHQTRTLFNDPTINAVEIDFSHSGFGSRPEVDLVSIYAPQLLLGTPAKADPERLNAMTTAADRNGAASITGRLAQALEAIPDEGATIAPVAGTEESLDNCCRNIDLLQDHFSPLSFYVESPTFTFEAKDGLSTADFLYTALRRTGCGWLLDLSSLFTESEKHGFDPHDFVSEVMPAAERVQLHLGSGIPDLGQSRCALCRAKPIAQPVWDLYRHALRFGSEKITAVFVERDQDPPDMDLWHREALRTRQIAEAVDAECCCCGR